MAKMYNVGEGYTDSNLHGVPTVKRADGEYVRVPRLFTGVIPAGYKGDHPLDQYVKHTEGQAYIPILGAGFFHVPKGASFELPVGVTAEDVKAISPHMMTEGEYIAMQAKELPAKPSHNSKKE